MNHAKFLDDFRDILQKDDHFDINTPLTDIEEWDSLSMMATIAYFDRNFAVMLSFDAFKEARSVADIAALIPGFTGDDA